MVFSVFTEERISTRYIARLADVAGIGYLERIEALSKVENRNSMLNLSGALILAS